MNKLGKLAVMLAAIGLAPHSGEAADAFYANKTITFLMGQDAGSGADLACRLIAQFMGPHIAGNPTIIVKNMPSTAGIAVTNTVGKESKKDGLTAACGPYAPSLQLFHNPGLQVDMTKFEIISGDGDTPMIYARSDVPPGIKTSADLFKVKPSDLVMGGLAVDSQKDVEARAFLATFGMDGYKYVTGFTGDSTARAAIQQKFINIYSESMTSYDQVTSKTLIPTGEVTTVVQGGVLDGNGGRIRDARAPNTPTFDELYAARFGKQPSGPAWQVLQMINNNVSIALRWVALPPGSPPEAVAAMRAAVAPMNADPEFTAASDKLRGRGIVERPGALVQQALNAYLNPAPDVFQFYDDLVKSGTALAQKK